MLDCIGVFECGFIYSMVGLCFLLIILVVLLVKQGNSMRFK